MACRWFHVLFHQFGASVLLFFLPGVWLPPRTNFIHPGAMRSSIFYQLVEQPKFSLSPRVSVSPNFALFFFFGLVPSSETFSAYSPLMRGYGGKSSRPFSVHTPGAALGTSPIFDPSLFWGQRPQRFSGRVEKKEHFPSLTVWNLFSPVQRKCSDCSKTATFFSIFFTFSVSL